MAPPSGTLAATEPFRIHSREAEGLILHHLASGIHVIFMCQLDPSELRHLRQKGHLLASHEADLQRFKVVHSAKGQA